MSLNSWKLHSLFWQILVSQKSIGTFQPTTTDGTTWSGFGFKEGLSAISLALKFQLTKKKTVNVETLRKFIEL